MELSPEIIYLITGYVPDKVDLCSLCQVSRNFRAAAERVLYSTLALTNPVQTRDACRMLADSPRLSNVILSLSITLEQESDASDEPSIPPDYWDSISQCLRMTTRLRSLNINVENGDGLKKSWILNGVTFQLQIFRWDLAWDADLVTFLISQSRLVDLYIADFNDDLPENELITSNSLRQASTLPMLSSLECTFSEAVGILVPGRPVTHVKSCFSRSEQNEKRAEMAVLMSNLRLATKPLRSLNISDGSYRGDFSLEFLTNIVTAFTPAVELRYLGALALPVDGDERLRFYGQLRRLRHLQCVEFDLSEWDPAPTMPAALRALARELHLYCASIDTVVFIYEFEPFVVKASGGIWSLEDPMTAEPANLWKEWR
ncbi:hypothetical protein EWM64_g4350 [Hericium alpestre]|uniref:Uncharacterized protein n=1 Tax=Hericium alpestre TaxID=135208 RepID=A0A4Y9ZZN7_9AGAM|nr:hypothetical protein EWM64_g4350 [Hericium alpestre]